jgi:hypothetical protein
MNSLLKIPKNKFADNVIKTKVRQFREILTLLLLVLSFSLSAKEINVKTISFQIDDSFNVLNSDNFSFMAEKGDVVVALAVPELKNFSPKKLFASMDTIYFNLSDAKLIKKKSELFFQWTKDYITKYYAMSDGSKVITHTFYTNNFAYCLLARYNSIDDEKIIIETIKSIWFNKQQSTLYKVFTVFNYASFFWIVFAIITSISGIALKEGKNSLFKSIMIYSLIAGMILLLLSGMHWEILGCALLINNIILIIAYYLGIYITFDVD